MLNDLAKAMKALDGKKGSGTTPIVKERQEDSDSPFTKKKRSRFAMIERKHKDSRRDTKDLSEDTLLKAAASSSDPLQGLLALQIAQNLQGSSRKGRRRRSTRSSSRSSSSSESDKGYFDKSLKATQEL